MGVNIDAQRNYKTDYMVALDKYVLFPTRYLILCYQNIISVFFSRAAEISIKRMHFPWLKWDSIFYRTKLGSEFKFATDTINNFTMQV